MNKVFIFVVSVTVFAASHTWAQTSVTVEKVSTPNPSVSTSPQKNLPAPTMVEKTTTTVSTTTVEKTPAPATPPATTKEGIVEELFTLSRIGEQLLAMPQYVLQGFKESSQSSESVDLSKIETIVASSFNPAIMKNTITKSLRDNYNDAAAQEAITFLRSPLYKKISDLESKSSSAEAQQEFQDFTRTFLQNNMTTKERIELIKELDSATGASEMMLEVVLSMTRYAIEGANNLAPAEKKLDQAQLGEMIAAQRKAIEAPLKEEMILSSLFAYRSLTDEQLQSYLNFYNTSGGKWLNDNLVKSFIKAMNESGKIFIDKLSEAAKRP